MFDCEGCEIYVLVERGRVKLTEVVREAYRDGYRCQIRLRGRGRDASRESNDL